MKEQGRIVVVGASAAGASAAHALRAEGFAGALTLVGEEPDLPYDRPPLSKHALLDQWQPEKLHLFNATTYGEMAIDLVLGNRAAHLDLDGRAVCLANGKRLEFDGLVIATGSTPRTLPQLSEATNVHSLRTTGDAIRLRQVFDKPNARLAVIGAGFIGTELAATARLAGVEVSLIDSASNPLEARLGANVGRMLGRMHRDRGVDLRMGVTVESSIRSSSGGRIDALLLSDGSTIEPDAIVVAIGAAPNIEWLRGSGLPLGNGVECDACCRVVDGIYAAGDVAEWLHPGYGRRLRIEHRTNAAEQAAAAAKNMLGASTLFAPMPFFWSDQFEVKLQMHGVVSHTDDVRVLYGSIDDPRFVIGFYANERLTGVLSWGAAKQARQWIPTLKSHWETF